MRTTIAHVVWDTLLLSHSAFEGEDRAFNTMASVHCVVVLIARIDLYVLCMCTHILGRVIVIE